MASSILSSLWKFLIDYDHIVLLEDKILIHGFMMRFPDFDDDDINYDNCLCNRDPQKCNCVMVGIRFEEIKRIMFMYKSWK